jgi:hypothetical protein
MRRVARTPRGGGSTVGVLRIAVVWRARSERGPFFVKRQIGSVAKKKQTIVAEPVYRPSIQVDPSDTIMPLEGVSSKSGRKFIIRSGWTRLRPAIVDHGVTIFCFESIREWMHRNGNGSMTTIASRPMSNLAMAKV